MKINLIGCSHHESAIAVREQLAFTPQQAEDALSQFRSRYPDTEAVLLSTCNRTEFYTAAGEDQNCPSPEEIADFLAGYHGISPVEVLEDLFQRTGADVVRHLFTVAASLDSMVVGEAQILSQVKQAYDLATRHNDAMPLTHTIFQRAINVAKRVATETAIQERRVSIPSVAVADFASQIFERFDDKKVIVIGAGEMGEETLTYLIDRGANDIVITNRHYDRAADLAQRMRGVAEGWDQLDRLLVEADLVISTTGASEPIVTLDDYMRVEKSRQQKTLFILDLAVPRDFDAKIGDRINVFLYTVDDLKDVCDKNVKLREKEWPKALKIIEHETEKFMAELSHRATGPTIRRLKLMADEMKQDELDRLLRKLDQLDMKSRREIEMSFDRLVNKLLHPPLESLRDHSKDGTPHGLIDALRRLFQLKD